MRLDRMSHGCDSCDYVTALREMPIKGPPAVGEPIIFLLENPGRDCELAEVVKFGDFRKSPPVRHYYWIPDPGRWPRCIEDIGEDFYNPYFAYLMWKHQLTNVYITNLVKCKEIADNGNAEIPPTRRNWKQDVVHNCTDRYLKRELECHRPRIAFCFGGPAEGGLRGLLRRDKDLRRCLGRDGRELIVRRMYHPAAFCRMQKHSKRGTD